MIREYSKKIHYPCETAAIFQDVLFVIRVDNPSELLSASDKAAEFYLGYFPFCELQDIREGILYSFGGLYLDDSQLLWEAA
ncbi:hypothetical protein [Pluralibacter gergoviae]|uniref:hypothetical protein n=1 Tax=Pluralibacter gergoviae TaxID=61647 RepID=UPI001FF1936A|nr:hypothetical protein [Pluralibacter gergoviae]MCK1065059.1 hypothetical protein [Pluralibacter gergoviae]